MQKETEKINCKRQSDVKGEREKNENPHANITLIVDVKTERVMMMTTTATTRKNQYKMLVVMIRRKEKIFQIESEQCECICVRVSAAILSLHLFILTDFCSRTVPLPFFSLICMCLTQSFLLSLHVTLSRSLFVSLSFVLILSYRSTR